MDGNATLVPRSHFPTKTVVTTGLRSVQQDISKPLGCIDHYVMACCGCLESPPGLVGLTVGKRLIEGGLGISNSPDVSLLGHPLPRAGKPNRLQRHGIRLSSSFRIDPGAVSLVDQKHFGLRSRANSFASGDCLQQRSAAELRYEIGGALAIFRLEGVEPHDRRDAIERLLDGTGARPAAVGMHHQADI